MHVIVDRSHVNVQEHFCSQQDSLQAYVGWLMSYVSSVDVHLHVAVDSLSLTNVDMPNRQYYTYSQTGFFW